MKRRKLEFGLGSIDSTLDGGLEYGRKCCISGEAGGSALTLSSSLLINHLLGTDSSATVIDTTLSFDVGKLHRGLAFALERRGARDAPQEAVTILDRLKIMKVFDFVGMTESVAELRNVLQSEEHAANVMQDERPAPRGTIGDSEDEDEMLDEASPPQPPTTSADRTTTGKSNIGSGLLIIDNITHIAAPLLRNNHSQGQALLTSFMRSLSHLTRAHKLCTVLLNHASTYQQAKDEAPSIFSSCTLRPALGKSFAYMLDLHLLVHEVPKTNADARAAYSNDHGSKQGKAVEVLEVLDDRYGGRAGRWAFFEVNEDGGLREVVLR